MQHRPGIKLAGCLLAALTLTVLVAEPKVASAKSKSLTVASGKRILVISHANWDSRCRSKPAPRLVMVKQPAHGRISMATVRETVSRDGGKCSGEKVSGRGVFYTSRTGFKGADSFTYRRLRGSGAADVWTINVTVK